MRYQADSFLSIRMASLLMKLVGFWPAVNEKEAKLRRVFLYYTIVAISAAALTAGIDFYFSFGDFYGTTYAACALMPVVLCLIKISGFIAQLPLVMKIIRYTQDDFWNGEYGAFGKAALRDTNRKGILLICSFTFFVQGTVVCYITTPLVENIGRNDSDRILAFNVWLPLNASESPYYEFFSVMLGLACAHAGLCFCCFDNFLCTLNIHVATQFRILQNRIESICDVDAPSINEQESQLNSEKFSNVCYNRFKGCVRRHQDLIKYVEDLEKVFTFLVLGQLLVSSVMVCAAGFQVAQARGTIIRRLIFVAHTFGSIFQLLVITVTANEVIVESSALSRSAYFTLWHRLSYDKNGKKLRDGLVMMMVRAKKPCCITAGRFFPVSLETFSKVVTSSMSYFTMLRQVEEDIAV